jgi:outer membrane protein TolC
MNSNACRAARGAAVFVLVLAISVAPAPGAAAETRPLSLDECISLAQRDNPDIAVAGETYTKAESGLLASYGRLLPGFSLGFYTGHRYYGPSSVQFDASGRPVVQDGFDYEDFTFRMSSDIQIFDGGETMHRIRAAQASRNAAREGLNYRRSYVEAQVIRAYYNVVRWRMLRTVAGESSDLAKRNLERTEALLEVGSATRADVLKARVRHSNTRLDVIEATNALEIAREELGALLRLEDAHSIEVDTALSIEFKSPDASAEIAYARTHRPDLKGLAYNVESAGAGIAAARSGWLPTLGASFNYNWNDRTMAENLNFFNSEYAWSVAAYVSIDVFDRFLTTANVRSAKADHRIAQHTYDKTKLDAEKQIRQLVLTMNQGQERSAVASETVEQAREDLRLAEERYRVGAGTMLETIDAQVALVRAKADVIQAKCDYLIAEADLAVATGRNVRE